MLFLIEYYSLCPRGIRVRSTEFSRQPPFLGSATSQDPGFSRVFSRLSFDGRPRNRHRLVLAGTYARPDAKRRMLIQQWRQLSLGGASVEVMVRQTKRGQQLTSMPARFFGGAFADLSRQSIDLYLCGFDPVGRCRPGSLDRRDTSAAGETLEPRRIVSVGSRSERVGPVLPCPGPHAHC